MANLSFWFFAKRNQWVMSAFFAAILAVVLLGLNYQTVHALPLDCSAPPAGVVCVGGELDVDQTWTANNTYVVNTSLNIRKTLVIEPGTIVKMSLGVAISVYGDLELQNSGQRVVFTSMSACSRPRVPCARRSACARRPRR